MGLFSFFKRSPAEGHGARIRRAVPPQDPATLEVLRTRARRRLIGAAVLVAVAVIAVPMALETQPRPSGQWTGEVAFTTMNSRPGAVEAARVSVAPTARETVPEDGALAASAPTPSVDRAPFKVAAKTSDSRPAEPKSGSASPAKAAEVPKDKPAEPAKVAAKDKPDTKEGVSPSNRYVLQVGAYAKMESADEMRERIHKLGLRSVYNTTDTAQGPRIRVRLGPFGSREAADRAVAQLKAGGIRAQVLTWEASR